MKKDLLKKGSISMVLGESYFQDFFQPQKNKILKVTHLDCNQNELKHMKIISSIPRASEYYALSEDLKFMIEENHPFYQKIQELMGEELLPSLQKPPLTCFYIDYAGDLEMYDAVIELQTKHRSPYWKKPKDILVVLHHIIEGLYYLHQHKICHLDVKLENIVIDSQRKTYKLVDFGYSSIEPFDDFISNPKGTPGYCPKFFEKVKINKYLPKINANDFVSSDPDGYIPFHKNYMLVYKIDSFCLGRTIYCLWQIFLENNDIGCCLTYGFKKNKKIVRKIELVLAYLLVNDVYQRLDIIDIYDRFWKGKKITEI